MNTNTHTSCGCGCSGGHACDCCTGPRVLTPQLIFNTPGQSALQRRAGDWDTFRRTMQAQLSDIARYPALKNLTTREPDDPSIAFLDAAAVLGDVLTFYNERLANEGYLRTATERRSLVELGKLVGYSPRPGVAASAWLAFTLDAGYNITVPAGSRVQSVPGSPDEKAQTFETTDDLSARAELNAMPARQSLPQEISPSNVINVETIWLRGTGLSLKPGDMLLFVFPEDEAANTPRKIHTVTEDAVAQRTTVKLAVEKLSASYYIPALRKNAQALRQLLPDAWLADTRPWAKNVAGSLSSFAGGLGADSSLLDIENLFLKKADANDPGLPANLAAVASTAGVADTMTAALKVRMAWKDSAKANLRAIIGKARTQEILLGKVFNVLNQIDATTDAELPARKSLALGLAELLAEGTPDVPGAVQSCFEPALTELRNLRALALTAAGAANTTVWNQTGLGPQATGPVLAVRRAVEDLGMAAGAAKTDRTDLMEFLEDADLELDTGFPSAAGHLLDTGANTLQKAINDATVPKIGTWFGNVRTALTAAWDALETTMRTALSAGTAVDVTLTDTVDDYDTLVTALPAATAVNHGARATALGTLMDETTDLYSGSGGIQGDLARISSAGGLATALLTQRARFQAESFSGLRESIFLLTGRYKNALPAGSAMANEMRALETAAGAISSTTGLAALYTVLHASLEKVTDAAKLNPDPLLNRLRAEMEILNGQVSSSPSGSVTPPPVSSSASGAALGSIVGGNTLKQPNAPGDPLAVSRTLEAFVSTSGDVASDAVSRLAGRLAGSTDDELFAAWRLLNTGQPAVEVYIMRVQTPVFGSSAPMRFGPEADKSFDARFNHPAGIGDWLLTDQAADDLGNIIRLDGEQNKVVRDSYLVIERPRMVEVVNAPAAAAEAPGDVVFQDLALFPMFMLNAVSFFQTGTTRGTLREVNGKRYREALYTRVRRVEDVVIASHSAFSLSGKATTAKLLTDEAWGDDPLMTFEIIRRARVYAASERLTLAEVPVDHIVGGPPSLDKDGNLVRTSENPFFETPSVLMLDKLYQGLEPGHRIMLAGERADDISARPVQEYALVSRVEHALIPALSRPQSPLPGDTPHTRLTLSAELQYRYKRSTLVVYGNVAEGTHGETKRETLGSGNARAVSQRMPLRSIPVTHVATATATGAESTVVLRVDKVQWHAVPQFTNAGPDDRVFMLDIADDGATSVVFGDGKQGARLPTGVENVTATYRSGIGQGGNVGAGRLTTLLDRPLGLKEVKNPLPAGGGADRDSAEQIRRNAPLPLLALDRLVSVSDYADFSRAFAGIGKAEATLIGGAGGGFVHVTIAGQDDALIPDTSSLMTGLTEALILLGDPLLPVRVQSRELLVLMLAASVRIDPDHAWADVEPALRAAVLAALGFARRAPGQDVFLSEVVAVMQAVPGVDFVDVDHFGGIPQQRPDKEKPRRRPLTPEEMEEAVYALLEGKTVDWSKWDAGEKDGEKRRVPVVGGAAGKALNPPPRLSVDLAGYDEKGNLRPAQLALFLADMPETLILNQLVS